MFHDIINILKIAGEGMNDLEKLCILEYDEMHVKEGYEYDEKNDTVVGSHSLMQVVMVRGLFGGWKQTIFAEFDFTMTKEKLLEIIELLFRIKFVVVGIVSDLSTGNQGVISKLINKYDGETFFSHPSDSNLKVFVFADAPHLLKLIRNWLLDNGFDINLPNLCGTVDKKILVELVEHTSSEISSCYRLSLNHVNCVKTARQNVAMACELLSHTTAQALVRYFPENEEALRLSRFIQIVNAWFDIFNSRHCGSSLLMKRPYGLHLDEQYKALQEMIELCNNMLPIGKRGMQVFQKAIIMSTKSLMGLYAYLKPMYEFSFILTKRLNQDCLESHFSHIRGKGGLDDQPSPITCLKRIKLISLGKNCGTIKKNTNIDTSDKDGEEFLLAKVFKAVQITIRTEETIEVDTTSQYDSDSTISSIVLSEEDTSTPELDGIEYLAGWIAFKFKETHPELGKHTYKLPASAPSWVQHLSFGGLMRPSPSWFQDARKMERMFTNFHKESFRSKKNIVKRLTHIILKKIPTRSEAIIKKFVKHRTIIRCRYLTKQMFLKKQKRDFRKSSESYSQQKLRKINYFTKP